MNDLAARIAEEKEVIIENPRADEKPVKMPDFSRISGSTEIMKEAMTKGRKACLAFSGGSDSLVLLGLARYLEPRPMVIWADSQMEYPETREFIEKTTKTMGFDLRIAKARIKPIEQWQKTGWPLLGKQPAREWNKKNKSAGFRLNCSECCRNLKIKPARRLSRNLGISVQFTGQKGTQDDNLRGFRAKTDGFIKYQKRDRMWIANPLIGWANDEIHGYIKQQNLPEHPARSRGAKNIGCVVCGGGSQFQESRYRILRSTWPEAWRSFMVDRAAGVIILAVKYKVDLDEAKEAVRELGGLAKIAEEMPWVFDFTRITPIKKIEK